MKKSILICLIVLCVSTINSLKANDTWGTNYNAAKIEAAKSGKKIILDFTGSDWCIYCKKLEAEVLSTPEFKTFSDNYVLVRLDYPRHIKLPDSEVKQNTLLKSTFGIEGYPTLIVVDQTGKEIARQVGYEPGSGPKSFIAGLTK
jgi:thioredoxin-related protein